MNKNKKWFLIVGAAKSGTTSIYHYLKQHPDIYLPSVKECRFFSQLSKNFIGLGAEFFPNSGITEPNEFFALYKGFEDNVCGDISNDYLYYYKSSIKNIKKYLGDNVKIIIILRNPIERAYSNFLHNLREGWEDRSFEDALISEAYRIENNWAWSYHYVRVGKYYNQVKAYIDNFSNTKIFIFDNYDNISHLVNEILEYLELPEYNIDYSQRYNRGVYPVSPFLNRFLSRANKRHKLLKKIIPSRKFRIYIRNFINNFRYLLFKEKLEIKKETRYFLFKEFENDIKKLESLLDIDLLSWKLDHK